MKNEVRYIVTQGSVARVLQENNTPYRVVMLSNLEFYRGRIQETETVCDIPTKQARKMYNLQELIREFVLTKP